MQNIKNTFSVLILAPLIVLSLTSCGQLAEMDSHSIVSRFQKSESLYSASMRWGDWSTLLQLLKNKPEEKPIIAPKVQQQTTAEKNILDDYRPLESITGNYSGDLNILSTPSEEMLTHLDTIKVQEVKILTSGMNDVKEDGGTGKTLFEITYRKDSSIKINTIRHKVDWWYFKEGNSWFTDTPLPKEFRMPKSRTIKLSPKRD